MTIKNKEEWTNEKEEVYQELENISQKYDNDVNKKYKSTIPSSMHIPREALMDFEKAFSQLWGSR